MTRIEQDENASDELLTDSWTSTGHRVIRSHRAPRNRFARRSVFALVLALTAGLLSAAGVAQRETAPEHTAAWKAPDELAVALAEVEADMQVPILDPAPRREAPTRASRSQRKVPSVQPSQSSSPRWVAPLAGKIKITGCFGEDRGDHAHEGLDFDGETGDTVRSVGGGRVVQVGYRFSGAGLTVTVQYGGTLVLYAHLSKTSVSVGAMVTAGKKLGEVGSTGNSTGSHLHLGVAKTTSLGAFWDRAVNPATWLRARGIAVPAC